MEELPESIAKGLAEREQSKVLIASLKKRDNFKAGARLQKLVVQLQDRRKESK